MMIPIANPKASYLACKELIDDAVFRVLESGWYVLGKENLAFARKFTGKFELMKEPVAHVHAQVSVKSTMF